MNIKRNWKIVYSGYSGVEKKAIDLIYNPEKTEFLRLAEGQGVGILNGQSMLFYQAYYSDCYYLNRSPNKEEAVSFYEKYIKTVD